MHLSRRQNKPPCRRVKPITNEKIKLCFWPWEGNSVHNAIVNSNWPKSSSSHLQVDGGEVEESANFVLLSETRKSSFLPGWIGQFVPDTPSCHEFSLCCMAFLQHHNHKHLSSLSLTLINKLFYYMQPKYKFP